jgi:hypothetical protein
LCICCLAGVSDENYAKYLHAIPIAFACFLTLTTEKAARQSPDANAANTAIVNKGLDFGLAFSELIYTAVKDSNAKAPNYAGTTPGDALRALEANGILIKLNTQTLDEGGYADC